MKKQLLLFLLSFLLLPPAYLFSQGSIFSAPVQTTQGQAIQGAAVAICTSQPSLTVINCGGSSKATIYKDLTLGTPAANPLTTDANGMYYVYGTPGTILWAQIYGAGITTYSTPFVIPGLGFPSSLPSLTINNGNGKSTLELDSYASILTLAFTGGVFPTTEQWYRCLRADGTLASPTSVIAGDKLCEINGGGYSTSEGSYEIGGGLVKMFAAETFSTGHHGTYLEMTSILPGTTNEVHPVLVDSAGGVDFGTPAATTAGLPSGSLYTGVDINGNLAAPTLSVGGSQAATGFEGSAGTKLASASGNWINGESLCSNATLDTAPCAANVLIANAGSTGTTLNKLAKLTGAPSTAVLPLTSDILGVVGITIAGAGTTGSALVQESGIASCVFDGATTAGDYVSISSLTAGDCADSGTTRPSNGEIIGRVLSTNAGTGTYALILFPTEIVGAYPQTVFRAASAATTGNLSAQTLLASANLADYSVTFYVSETVLGSSCSSDSQVSFNLIWQDPNESSGIQNSNIYNVTTQGSGDGALGRLDYNTGFQTWTIRAKSGSVISYSTSYSPGASCSPAPTYQVDAVLEQISAN